MWHWVKACKGAALVAFLLPWMTVSCSSTELLRASGLDLAIGKPRLTPQLAQLAGERAARGDAHPNLWLILALILIVVGLVFAFRPARQGAPAAVMTSVGALVLTWVATRAISSDVLRRAAARSGDAGGLDAALALQIRIDWQIGYWLCLLALAGAAVLAGISLSRRSAVP